MSSLPPFDLQAASKEPLLQEKLEEDFITFLRFQSISAELKKHASEMTSCARWVQEMLEEIGLHVEVWGEEEAPILFGVSSKEEDEQRPTWAIYHHYDVQPASMEDGWDSPPFAPRVEGDRIYARGAQDNKGQCLASIYALKLLRKVYGPPASWPFIVKILIEGEEESGSNGLRSILPQKKEQLSCDGWAVIDIDIPAMDRPSVTLGMRGIVAFELTLKEANADLHSGLHGNLAYNPNRALCELVASCFTKEGKIAIEGFYEGIERPKKEEMEGFDLHFDPAQYTSDFGMEPLGGWCKHAPLERLWFDPSLEVNGICGGYIGEGFKTVIPASAQVKISSRLVAGQDPDHVKKMFLDHIDHHLPSSIEYELSFFPGAAPAIQTSPQAPLAKAFRAAISKERQAPCRYIYSGASVPICSDLHALHGSDVIGVGYGLSTDQIHGPNEHFELSRLRALALAIATALASS